MRLLAKNVPLRRCRSLMDGEQLGQGSGPREIKIVESGPDWVILDDGSKYRTSVAEDGVNRYAEERIFDKP